MSYWSLCHRTNLDTGVNRGLWQAELMLAARRAMGGRQNWREPRSDTNPNHRDRCQDRDQIFVDQRLSPKPNTWDQDADQDQYYGPETDRDRPRPKFWLPGRIRANITIYHKIIVRYFVNQAPGFDTKPKTKTETETIFSADFIASLEPQFLPPIE